MAVSIPPQSFGPMDLDAPDLFNKDWWLKLNGIAAAVNSLLSVSSAPDGGAPTPGNDGYYTITPAAGAAVIDLANGLNQRLELNATAVTINLPIWTGGTIAAGQLFWLYIDQDATGGRAQPTFAAGYSADFNNANVAPIAADLSTRTAIALKFHGSVWCIDSWRTLVAIA